MLRVKYADLRPRSYFLSSLLLSAEASTPSRITSVGLWSSESEVLRARPNPSLAMVVRSMISNFLSTSPHPSCVIMKRLPLPASKLKHGQERGPVSADQRQRWRHFSTSGSPWGVPCSSSRAVVETSQSFILFTTSNFISIPSHQNHCGFVLFRVPSNLKGAIVRNANQILTLATATAPPCFTGKAARQ